MTVLKQWRLELNKSLAAQQRMAATLSRRLLHGHEKFLGLAAQCTGRHAWLSLKSRW
jgi:hypothetical protein